MKRIHAFILAVFLGASTGAVIGNEAVYASPRDNSCATVEVVFARGSGQKLFIEKEVKAFEANLNKGIAAFDGATINFFELGQEDIPGVSYPAVPVSGSWDAYMNAGDAWFSNGEDVTLTSEEYWKYGKSVDTGVKELAEYIDDRIDKCEAEGNTPRFILAGYSQGAQVIGETYVKKLTDSQRKYVVFNALFGDPKLYLPEGESRWHKEKEGDLLPGHYALACKGDWSGPKESHYSPYRRDVPDCDTDNGSLGARKPYLPSGWETSSGLWCNDDDFVCGSDKRLWVSDGHMTYSEKAVPDAAEESLTRLCAAIKEDGGTCSDSELKKLFLPVRAGTTGLDVVFLIDSTSSMTEDIEDAKRFAEGFSKTIKALNGRVALVEYRDAGDEFTARILSGLNGDVSDFQTKLDAIRVDGGGDSPEAVLHALSAAFEGLEWRNGATKAAVILTDAGFHNPDVVDSSTIASIAKRSLEIDPVNVYPVVPTSFASRYEELAEMTSGQVIENTGDAEEALNKALTKIATRPVVQLPLNAYYAPVGETVYFDASSSYSVDSEITRWDWDFDGDGVYEVEDGTSQEKFTYSVAGDFNIQVRATDANDGIASHSVPVHIGTITGTEGQPAPVTEVTVTGNGTEATVSWTTEEQPTGGWGISVNGVHIGGYVADARQATITDLDRSSEIEFGVTPISADDVIGQTRVAYLAADVKEASLVLSSDSIEQGGSLNVSGANLTADAGVEIWLHSDPVKLATVTTSDTGSFDQSVTIPKDATTGAHKIVVKYGDKELSADLTVTKKDPGTPTSTPSEKPTSEPSDKPTSKQPSDKPSTKQPSSAPSRSGGKLVKTGSEGFIQLAAGGVLVLVGGGLWLAARRRRQ